MRTFSTVKELMDYERINGKVDLYGEGEARIIMDGFLNDVIKNRLHKIGYRNHLWNQWIALWKQFTIINVDRFGNIEYEDMIGTREKFDEMLKVEFS